MKACMTVVREIAVWERRRENNIKLDLTTTIWFVRRRTTRYIHFRVQWHS
jgi:hypothetical protein